MKSNKEIIEEKLIDACFLALSEYINMLKKGGEKTDFVFNIGGVSVYGENAHLEALKAKDKEKEEIEKKFISININALNQPTDAELGKMIKDMLRTRTIREPYWEGSKLSGDYLYLKIHQS